MAASTTSDLSPGDVSPELVPVVEPGTLPLAFSQPADAGLSSELALGDLLSDALFGEVIDISDLIPRMAPTSTEAVALEPPPVQIAATEVEISSGEFTGYVAIPLSIIYDDDLLAGSSF